MREKDLLDFIAERSNLGESVSVITKIGIDGKAEKFVVGQGTEYLKTEQSSNPPDEIIRTSKELIASRKTAAIIEDSKGSDATYVIEVIRPKPSLVILGAGHVGQAVALIGALIGYDVTVVDDRQEFLSRSRLPDARIKLMSSNFGEAVQAMKLTRNTAVVIVTRGHQYDEICLRGVVNSAAGYIGMIGSKRRVLSIFARLKQDGVPADRLEHIHAPIGLQIGAKSPQEIAVAILAEVISCLG